VQQLPGSWAAGESEQSQKSASLTWSYQLAGPGAQSEQLFVCPDFPASKTNNHSTARISQIAARTKKPELEALAFVRGFTSFLSNDK
jgi:hypothetical protein